MILTKYLMETYQRLCSLHINCQKCDTCDDQKDRTLNTNFAVLSNIDFTKNLNGPKID